MLSLSRKRATDDFFDVTGERIFMMGHEKPGIGEIWVPPFRVLSYLRWGLTVDGDLRWSQEFPVSFTAYPGTVVREAATAHWKVTEQVTCSRQNPSGLSRLRFRRLNDSSSGSDHMPTHLVVSAVVDFCLMWPYPPSTVTCDQAAWNEDLKAFEFNDRRNLVLALLGSPQPSLRQQVERAQSGTRWGASLVFDLKDHDQLDIPLVVAASNRSRSEATEAFDHAARNPGRTQEDQAAYHNDHLDNNLLVESPDVEFNQGFQWAVVGLDRHFLHTPGLGKGYAAGFAETTPGWGQSRPGFAWYFGRDSVWTSLAALAYGDFEKVRNNLELLGDFQDISGKIFHELTLSGVAHYDSADATPLYVVLMGEYVRWSGDTEFLHSQWDRVENAMNFLRSTIRNEFNLIENRNVGHGWVEGGPLAGSDVEIHLAACWAEALRQMAYLAQALGHTETSRACRSEYDTVIANMDALFWNASTRTYDLGLQLGSQNKTETTVLPAVAILFDQLPFERSRSVASRFSGKEFSTPWGVRIQSTGSASYQGSGYHSGSVWPLFTGWCSLAEYKTHLAQSGFTHILATLRNFKKGALGLVEEVLDGETGGPKGVCHHQAWSEAMVCLPVIRGMLGLDVDALKNRIRLQPHIPPDWTDLKCEGIRMGNSRLAFSFRKKGTNHAFRFDLTGTEPVTLEFEPWIPSDKDAITVTIDGESRKVPLHRTADCTHPRLSLSLKGKMTVTLTSL